MEDNSLRLRSGKQIAKSTTREEKQRVRSKSFTTAHEYANAGNQSKPNNYMKQRNHNSISSSDSNSNSSSNGQHLTNGVHSLLSDTNAELNRRLSVSFECDVKTIVLWRRPLVTIYYAIRESIDLIARLVKWTLLYTRSCVCVCLLALALFALSRVDGPHQQFIAVLQSQLLWSLYWCGLGILSSVGLGTGLHTFLLYLGPHIASVTLAAYECESLDFPSPPYPDQITCPDSETVAHASNVISVWSIMAKVRLEAFMWGAGTALGELPPYFVAKAHRLSGEEEEDMDDIESELAHAITGDEEVVSTAAQQSIYKRVRTRMVRLVKDVGFWGILLCASIPNPLFDLAGITCGYSLIPFWTFFGATLIGKAVIKMHLQKLFVIVAFNENYVERFVETTRNIPIIGEYCHEPIRELLVKQKKSFHSDSQSVREVSYLQTIFEWVVIAMIAYFLVSIINSMAQNYQKRVIKEHEDSEAKERRRSSAVSNHSKSNLSVKSKG